MLRHHCWFSIPISSSNRLELNILERHAELIFLFFIDLKLLAPVGHYCALCLADKLIMVPQFPVIGNYNRGIIICQNGFNSFFH
jgi:hypothetical protein